MDLLIEDQKLINNAVHTSTITATGYLNTNIDLKNVSENAEVSFNDILSMSYKNECKTIDDKYKKKEKKKRQKK
jgi:hypothetical protein